MENQNDYYYAPFSDQRRSLRVKWNMEISEKKIDWNIYLDNAEKKYQDELFLRKQNYNS